MDFIDQIKKLSEKVAENIDKIETEEATKNAFIMPFIQALGYNVFNPSEVIPEFIADIGNKKGEKVDYAIKKNNKLIILIECKSVGTDLKKTQAAQLRRYFHTKEARIGILTNGIIYQFYSDLGQTNIMDEKPFLELNLLKLNELRDEEIEQKVKELMRFKKESFKIEKIKMDAIELKYTKEFKKIFKEQLELSPPPEDFVKFITAHVYTGVKTKSVLQKFSPIVERAYKQFFAEELNNRFKKMMVDPEKDSDKSDGLEESDEKKEEKVLDDGIVTTDEEIQGFLIVRAILCEIVDTNRVVLRDLKSYCNVLFDNNNRKPICRFYFDRKQKYVGFFDENKKEETIPIDNPSEIYRYSEKLKATIGHYEK